MSSSDSSDSSFGASLAGAAAAAAAGAAVSVTTGAAATKAEGSARNAFTCKGKCRAQANHMCARMGPLLPKKQRSLQAL